jgi:dihydropyrimidine dehydrogenase (NAD+) subunit PreA
MAETSRASWHDLVKRVEDTGCDGLELNFGCPHGMSERGMGSAVGQVPKYAKQVTEWVKEVASTPVLVKLTPNVTDIRYVGRAAVEGGADALSLINTINSIIGVDLETLEPKPSVAGRGSHGGYCGPAVKPIALNMVQQLAADPDVNIPISGIGGVQAWQDAVEFLLLGASNVQVCTAVMHYGFRIVEHLKDGMERWMREKGFERLDDFVGASVPSVGDWADLDLGYRIVAEIDQTKCINCGLCYIACEDGAHQSIKRLRVESDEFAAHASNGGAHDLFWSGRKRVLPGLGDDYANRYEINQDTCVGCNLCSLVCPVTDCITMHEQPSRIPHVTWREYQKKLAAGEMDPIEPPEHV